MKITTKFIGSSALLVLLVALFSGSSYWLNRRAASALEASYVESQQAATAVNQLESALQDELAAVSRMAILSNKQLEIATYQKRYQDFSRTLETFAQTVPPDDLILQAQIKTIRTQHQYVESLADRALSEDISGRQLEGLSRSLKIFEDSINIYIQALLKESEAQANDYRLEAETFYAQVAWLEVLGLAALLLLLAAQFRYLLRPHATALGRLQADVDRMGRDVLADLSAGKTAIKIQMDTGDELQKLAAAFNHMSDRLAESYHDLERRVAERTESLNQANLALQVEVCDRTAAEAKLKRTLERLRQTQLQLLQTEKMSSLGQLVAGVAHEINNPVSFIQGNLEPAQEYADSLIRLVRSYQAECPEASDELQQAVAQAEVDFIESDFPQLLQSMQTGAERITTIVRSLRTFSRLDESETKSVDLHQGLESVLLLLAPRLSATTTRPAISIMRDYGSLPEVYCYPSQLNQVFMGLLTNAIDALTPNRLDDGDDGAKAATEDFAALIPTITIKTEALSKHVRIYIQDNGPGMSEQVRAQIFNPFFTTKPVGDGVGLGLAMSYQIVVANHHGTIRCQSSLGTGTRFVIDIPLTLKLQNKPAITLVS